MVPHCQADPRGCERCQGATLHFCFWLQWFAAGEAHSQGKPGWVLGIRVDDPAEMFQQEHTVSESFENDCVLLKRQGNPSQVVKNILSWGQEKSGVCPPWETAKSPIHTASKLSITKIGSNCDSKIWSLGQTPWQRCVKEIRIWFPFLLVFFFFFRGRFSEYSPGWPWTYNHLASVLGLQVCTTTMFS